MNVGLDTSIVVRLLVGEPAAEADAARALLADTADAGARCVIHDLVIAESWFALRTHYRVPDRDVARALLALADDPVVVVSVAARQALTTALEPRSGAGFPDRLIHAAYESAGCRFATVDRDAAKLAGAIRVKRGTEK